MPEIRDTGKVWIKGTSGPEYAVRVDEKVIVPGRKEDEELECWMSDDYLYADIHAPSRYSRILRRFKLDLSPTTPATLFNGFNNTKHADVQVVTFQDPGVEELSFQGESYHQITAGRLESREFEKWAAENGRWQTQG